MKKGNASKGAFIGGLAACLAFPINKILHPFIAQPDAGLTIAIHIAIAGVIGGLVGLVVLAVGRFWLTNHSTPKRPSGVTGD